MNTGIKDPLNNPTKKEWLTFTSLWLISFVASLLASTTFFTKPFHFDFGAWPLFILATVMTIRVNIRYFKNNGFYGKQ
jgi:hypothetical protein